VVPVGPLPAAKRPRGPLAPANGETFATSTLSGACSHLTAIPSHGSSVRELGPAPSLPRCHARRDERRSNTAPTQCPYQPAKLTLTRQGLAAAPERAQPGSATEQPTSPSRSVIRPRWPDPLPTARGWEPRPILLDYSSASQPALLGSCLRHAGSSPGQTPLVGAAGSAGTRPCSSGGEQFWGARARALRGRAGSLPFPLPQRAPRVSAHGALLPLRGDPQPHAAAAKRRARRHAPAVRQGLLKSDTAGAAMSQFLSANGPGLVFPSAFLAACELAALAWRSYSLPRVRVCARFFLPSWAQLRILVLIPCKMT